jgi:hypothetical protein
MSVDAIDLAEMLKVNERTFGRDLPAALKPPEGLKIVADPNQKLQMLLKLIDLKAQHLSELQRRQFRSLSYARDCTERIHSPLLRHRRAATCNAQSIGIFISGRRIFSFLASLLISTAVDLLEQSQ